MNLGHLHSLTHLKTEAIGFNLQYTYVLYVGTYVLRFRKGAIARLFGIFYNSLIR